MHAPPQDKLSHSVALSRTARLAAVIDCSAAFAIPSALCIEAMMRSRMQWAATSSRAVRALASWRSLVLAVSTMSRAAPTQVLSEDSISGDCHSESGAWLAVVVSVFAATAHAACAAAVRAACAATARAACAAAARAACAAAAAAARIVAACALATAARASPSHSPITSRRRSTCARAAKQRPLALSRESTWPHSGDLQRYVSCVWEGGGGE